MDKLFAVAVVVFVFTIAVIGFTFSKLAGQCHREGGHLVARLGHGWHCEGKP